MKNMKMKLIGICLLIPSFNANAQFSNQPLMALANGSEYQNAIGLRAGETSGLTLKHFMGGNTALEGIFGIWNHGLSATVLFEKYAPAFSLTGMKWYYGAGGHIAVKNRYHFRYYEYGRYYYYQESNIGLGLDGVVGLEYKIPKIPFAVNLELKPYMEVISNGGIWMSLDPGLGIKLTF